MRSVLRRFAGVVLLMATLLFSLAVYAFPVSRIQFVGLQRIPTSTARSYLPLHEGEDFTSQRGEKIIASLYATGFFSDIQLSRRDSALIITVKERPTIGLLKINGNDAVPANKIRPVLSKFDVVEGQPFDPAKVNEISRGLAQEYAKMGYHAVKVTPKVVKAPRNRVLLYLNIKEGPIAKVHHIRFIGNHAFSDSTLRDQFAMKEKGLLTWFHHRDRYSEFKLNQDLQSLAKFYMNYGYLRFRIVSHKAVLTADRSGVDIIITVDEGPIYHVSGFAVSGKTFGFKDRLQRLVTIRRGDVFSRQQTVDTNKAIGHFLANRGYAFATAMVVPSINDQNHSVFITFKVVPGKRVYVRRINFFGNKRTDQKVLRREMRQYEGATYSLAEVERSKQRLSLLPYFKDVNYKTRLVNDSGDQVDLDYHLKEVPAGKATVQGGWSSLYGFLYGANITEPNVMGSGKYVALGFQNSKYFGKYSFDYNNPYYTTYGLSRGFSLYYTHVKPSPAFNLQSYYMDGYGATVNYGYPVSERNYIRFGYGFEHIAISRINTQVAAPSVLAFLGSHLTDPADASRQYNQFKMTAGWDYNNLDRAIFPTHGLATALGLELGAPVIPSSYGYYITQYAAKFYQPIGHGFILNLLANVAYGDGFGRDTMLPFYKNFYAGGIGSVPAYAPNSLGPLNRYNSNASIGGNLQTIIGVHIILPEFISEKVRTALIFDAGNVFQTPRFAANRQVPVPIHSALNDPQRLTTPQIIEDNRFALSNLRPSLGLSVEWYTPLAPIDITLAFPLNKRDGDEYQAFQFSFGAVL